MKHKNFHPAICEMLDMFDDLQSAAQLRANTIYRFDEGHNSEIDRARAQATADAYDFMKIMLMQLDRKL